MSIGAAFHFYGALILSQISGNSAILCCKSWATWCCFCCKSWATAQFFVANQWQHGANFVANQRQPCNSLSQIMGKRGSFTKKREDYTSALGWEKGTCNPRVMCVGSVVYFDCVSSCRQMRNALKLVAPEISVVCWQRQHLISLTPPPVLPLRGGTCGRK